MSGRLLGLFRCGFSLKIIPSASSSVRLPFVLAVVGCRLRCIVGGSYV